MNTPGNRCRASPAHAALWRYADIRELVMDAGRLITAHEAERRVLILEKIPGRVASLASRSCCTPAYARLPG